MNLKKIKTIGIFIIFILCFINHFIYNMFPNFITSVFFPVNESIWEHMKMVTTSILMWQVAEYIVTKKKNIQSSNFFLSSFIMCIISIIIFLIIYYPIYLMIGENFILNIICLLITIYFVCIIGYYIQSKSKIKYSRDIGIIGIIILYVLFTYLTYNPPKQKIFLDNMSNTYGVNP